MRLHLIEVMGVDLLEVKWVNPLKVKWVDLMKVKWVDLLQVPIYPAMRSDLLEVKGLFYSGVCLGIPGFCPSSRKIWIRIPEQRKVLKVF